MIQVYADGVLAFDSRLEDYDLQGLTITSGLNKGGTAEITMPPQHPAYSLFVGYRTVVEIYRDNVLRFRGRALYPVDDFNNLRTVVCEGEFCFLQDAISRPYLYQTDPASVFAAVIADYNAQVEPFKQFKVGKVTVTDANDYIRLESGDAETVKATVNKLLDRCGGYIVFTTDEDGTRVINWLEQVGRTSGQTIELGENLFDVTRSGANTDLATALVPYGAKDETTGKRLTIESVNGGKDYIVDEEAAAIRGTITKSVIWDDVTTPETLLKKARQQLNESKMIVTSLKLTALDLSYVDKSIDSYEVGDLIRVLSEPHRIDENFQLVEHSEDLLNPANNSIVLGKEITSLTGADVAAADKSKNDIQQLEAVFSQGVSSVTEGVETVKGEMVLGIAKDSTGKSYSYLKSNADYIKFEGDDLEINTSQFNLDRDGNATFSGTLAAPSGNIGGLSISGQTITSGNDGMTFTSDGLVIAQNLEVRNDFSADTLKIGHIGGRNDGAAALHFESTVTETKVIDVAVSIIYYSDDEDSCYCFKISFSEPLKEACVVEITWRNSSTSTKTYSSSCTFNAGSTGVRAFIPYDKVYSSSEILSYTPEKIRYETGETLASIGCEGSLSPYGEGLYQLGSTDAKWNEIWATNGAIQTSDENEKNTISPLAEKYGEVFDLLVPVTYKFNVNTSDRLHLGLIAQDVKRALDEVGIDSKDFAAYCEWKKENGSIGCGLRYTELIAMIIHETQKLKARINALENRSSSIQP